MEFESGSREGISLDDVKIFFNGFVAAQVLGLLSIVFVSVWVSKYLGGLDLSAPLTAFNYHPLLMVIGMIFTYGNGNNLMVISEMHIEYIVQIIILYPNINSVFEIYMYSS